MPQIPFTSSFEYLAVLFLVLGVFIFVAGIGVISIKNVEILKGKKSLVTGITLIFVGVIFLIISPKNPIQESTTKQVETHTESPSFTAPPVIETPSPIAISTELTIVPTTTSNSSTCPELELSQVMQHSDSAILFDEAHENGLSLSKEKARQIDPRPQLFFYAGDLADFLRQQNYRFEAIETGSFSPTLLANYDLLVIAVGTLPYSNCEVEAVRAYVEKGGGLFVFGDGVPANRIASLLEVFGARLTGGPVSYIGVEGMPENFYVTDFSGHPATGTTTRVWFNWGTNIELLDGSWSVLLSSSENTWLDVNQDRVTEDDEQRGPFVLGVAREYGRGRIIIYGDNTVWDYYRDQNYPMYLAMVRWSIGDPGRPIP